MFSSEEVFFMTQSGYLCRAWGNQDIISGWSVISNTKWHLRSFNRTQACHVYVRTADQENWKRIGTADSIWTALGLMTDYDDRYLMRAKSKV